MPEKSELRGFSNYFTSFLTTSFELVEAPVITNNNIGCFCEICLKLANLSHLKSRAPKKHDRKIAAEKRAEIIQELAHLNKIKLTEKNIQAIANSESFGKQAAYLAYTKALLQRIEHGEGGVYILALWREIAWIKNGGPIKDFELKVEAVLAAEQRIKLEIFNYLKE